MLLTKVKVVEGVVEKPELRFDVPVGMATTFNHAE